MNLQEAKTRFDRAMGYCDDIIAVHRGHGGGERGLRTLETSLNRAVVVLAAAAWQTAVQDLTMSALDHHQPAGGMGVGPLLRGQVQQQIAGFSTPNAENSRALMKLVDFDPFPLWTWTQHGGRATGMVTITSSEASTGINEWLRLRHDIAHGHPTLSVVSVLEGVRQAVSTFLTANPNAQRKAALDHLKATGFQPSLRLKDAERCVGHFRRLATISAKGLAATGVPPANVW